MSRSIRFSFKLIASFTFFVVLTQLCGDLLAQRPDVSNTHFFLDAIAELEEVEALDGGLRYQKRERRRPNVLILMNDDMSRHCVGATGGLQAITPNIDAIAKRGTVLQNVVHQGAFSGAICTCSRAMMLTGRPLWSVTPGSFNYQACSRLKTDDTLFPEQFKAEGWQTFGTGKWHNGNAALLRSFDHAEAITGGMLPFNSRDHGGAKDNAIEIGMMDPSCIRITKERTAEKHGSKGWSTDVFYDAAESFIDDTWNRDKPFMMYISTNAPHDPRHVPDDILARFQNVSVPPNFRAFHPFDSGHMNVRDEMVYRPPHSPETVSRERAIYLAMCAQIDDRIGQLVAKLESIGQLENTIILLTSDHGLAVGEHGLLGKQNLYDGSWRVPMILAGPGIPKGESRSGFAYLHGIYPTLADFAGIEAPPHSKEFEFASTVRGQSEGQSTVFGAYMPDAKDNRGVRAVRSADFKLLYYTHSERKQLFNVAEDPWETNDLIGDPKYVDQADQLFASLKAWMKSSGDPLGK